MILNIIDFKMKVINYFSVHFVQVEETGKDWFTLFISTMPIINKFVRKNTWAGL